MAYNSAFKPEGKTVTLTAGLSSGSKLVTAGSFGLNNIPETVRLANNGTADIWMYISKGDQGPQTAAFPTAGGQNDIGTPQPGFRLKPGIVEVFTTKYVGPDGFYVNDISTSASQTYDITPGVGL